VKSRARKIVLICTLGKSPQVVTETVWALAHATPKVVPDEVIAIATTNYAAKARACLFGAENGWQALLDNLRKIKVATEKRLHFSSGAIRIVADEEGFVNDLRTVRDNERCAEYIFQTIRSITDGEGSEETSVVMSLSGGRKSMVAMASTVMSLLARPFDKLLHVIVNEELEDKKFHFPKGNKGFSLFEVPFVRVRGILRGADSVRTRSFKEYLLLTQNMLPSAMEFPLLTLDVERGTLAMNSERPIVEIDPARFMLLWLLFREKVLERDRFRDMISNAQHVSIQEKSPVWFRNLRAKRSIAEFRQIVDLTKKIVLHKQLGLPEICCKALLPNSNGKASAFDIRYPKDKLVVVDNAFSAELYSALMK